MADTSLPVQNVTADNRLDTESVTGHPDGTVRRERVEITGAALAEVAAVKNAAPTSSLYALIVRVLGLWSPNGDSVINDTNDSVKVEVVSNVTTGATVYRTISAASTNSTNVKSSSGNVFQIIATNTNASARWLKMYNKASAPTIGTDTPYMTLLLPGNGGVAIDRPHENGIPFSNGIGFGLTTGVGDSDTGAVAANDIVVHILYK